MPNAVKRTAPKSEAKISVSELAELGGGQVAYIKQMTSKQARKLFPTVKNLPKDIDLFSLHAADGTPLALTDSRQAALGQALEDDLAVASLH